MDDVQFLDWDLGTGYLTALLNSSTGICSDSTGSIFEHTIFEGLEPSVFLSLDLGTGFLTFIIIRMHANIIFSISTIPKQ